VTERVGVLGPGGIGGSLAVHLSQAGFVVICVAKPDTAVAIERGALTLDWQGRTLTADPSGTSLLDGPVDLLLVTVKAPDLDDALGRVEQQAVEAAVILPLMNGLEHVQTIRERLGRRVAAGSIGWIEAYKTAPTSVVQTTPQPTVAMASDDVGRDRLDRVAAIIERAGVAVRIEVSEQAVLWEKAARLAPLAVLTALTGRSVGEVRSDPEWRPQLEESVREACAVATADGAPNDPEQQLAIIDRIPPGVTTSTARDVAAGRPSELDAIVGAVVRAGSRLRVPTPTLESLLDRCRAS
jgi:2-dehydropantoate 2-reductase